MQEICGGFLMKKNKFLFGKRSGKKRWAPKKWDIMGGHLLSDETPLNGLKREAWEETGITVLHARLLTSLTVPDTVKGAVFKYHIYMITSWKGKVRNTSSEHSALRWLTRKQLSRKKIALPVYMDLIDHWLNYQADMPMDLFKNIQAAD